MAMVCVQVELSLELRDKLKLKIEGNVHSSVNVLLLHLPETAVGTISPVSLQGLVQCL